MFGISRIGGIALMVMFAAIADPLGARAQNNRSATEFVTIQLDATTLTGTHIAGSLVIERVVGTGTARLDFNGTIDGAPALAAANATETWNGSDSAVVAITEITSWNAPIPRPQAMSIKLSQVGGGLVTLNGIPLAVSAPLAPPGSGNLSYVATTPNQGEIPITFLPKTGQGGAGTEPLLIVGFLVSFVPLTVGLGVVFNKLGTNFSRASQKTK